MEPTAIRVGLELNSNSEKHIHMTAICDARLIYGRGGFGRYICIGSLRGTNGLTFGVPMVSGTNTSP